MATKKSPTAPTLAQFKKFVAGVDLQSILLVAIQGRRFPIEILPGLAVSFDQEIKGEFVSPESIAYEVKHRLEIKAGDEQLYSMELGHVVSYKTEFPEASAEIIQRFGEESVRLTIAPFARELILRLTAEAGLPPLLVGLTKKPG